MSPQTFVHAPASLDVDSIADDSEYLTGLNVQDLRHWPLTPQQDCITVIDYCAIWEGIWDTAQGPNSPQLSPKTGKR